MENLPLAIAYYKTALRWAGPFLVSNIYPATDNYRLKLSKQYNRIHPPFHVHLLKHYIENDNKKFPLRRLNRPKPLPEFKDKERYEVEQLLGHRIDKKGKVKYNIKWKGYGNETTWELAYYIPRTYPRL